jgi:uncharacterized protein (DUF1810 family)
VDLVRPAPVVPCAARRAPVSVTRSARLRRASGRAIRLTIYALPRSVRGLETSHNATYYGIENAAKAAAYLSHPVLGARLRECVAAILAHPDKSAHAILGSPDDAKFRSCLTLFRAVAAPDDNLWQDALDQFYMGEADPATLRMLEG